MTVTNCLQMFTLAIFITACVGLQMTPSTSSTTTPSSRLMTPALTTRATNVDMPSLAPAMCSDATSTTTPLGRLRSAMRNKSYTQMNLFFDAFLIFYSDEHLSEEPSTEERRLEYFSGWDGAGTAAVLSDGGAAVWVSSGDLRRARATLSCAWEVLDGDDVNQPTIPEWIAERLARSGRIGADARLTSVKEWQALSTDLQQIGLQLFHTPTMLDQIWNEELDPARRRPDFSKIVAVLHKPDYTGVTWRDKVSTVRNELRAIGADAMVITSLDEVAWLLNIRGKDLPYAPLLKAFVIVSTRDVRVYAPPGKLSMPVREALAVYNCFNNNCTRVNDYTNIYSDLRRATESKILIPASGTFQRGASAAIAQSVPQTKRMFLLSPIIYLKAQKNEAESNGMKKAHLRDAVAMCTLLSYLEGRRGSSQSEMSISKTVEVTRETQAGFVGLSMKTRVAFGPNGADPYYVPTILTNRRVFSNSTLIIRSGGQYDEGTTVVTRTLHYGKPSRDETKSYTTVLRSLAALSTLQSPASLPAAHADPVARAPLWAYKQDYPHPTGHGVGAALNRHEDPVVIDYRQDVILHPFREGYYITVEPGWYEGMKFGVQLGNVLEVISKPSGYIGFREATLLPFEPKLIDKNMLTDYEINWLNSYNDRIRKIVGPELQAQGLTDVYYWMSNKTVPIQLPSKIKKLNVNCASSNSFKQVLAIIIFNFVFVIAII